MVIKDNYFDADLKYIWEYDEELQIEGNILLIYNIKTSGT